MSEPNPPAPKNAPAASPAPAAEIESTPPLLARLFVVPALIVVLIIGCAIAVVLLFGAIASEKERSIDDLVVALEESSGRPSNLGVLWPKDKEYYHAERELLLRLQNDEVPADEKPELAERLVAVLERVLAVPPHERTLANERCLMTALGLLQQPVAVDTLVDALRSEERFGVEAAPSAARDSDGGFDPATTAVRHYATRRLFAAEALAMLKDVPESRRALPELEAIVAQPGDSTELRMVACVSLSVLAPSGDPAAVLALKDAYFGDDLEVKWNAALGLARLGDDSAASLLREMLRREYWEQPGLVRITNEDGSPKIGPDGQPVRQNLTQVQVAGYLVATMEAVEILGPAGFEEQLRALERDPSPEVRDRAKVGLAAAAG